MIQQLLPDADGSVFAATNYGLLGWRNEKALTLTRKNGLPCEQVYAIAFDRSNDLWLYMNCALGLVTSADFRLGSRILISRFRYEPSTHSTACDPIMLRSSRGPIG